MIVDSQAEFSVGQAVTSSVISTNVIDAQPFNDPNTLRDLGLTPAAVYLVIEVTQSVTAAGAATVTFSLESDSTADLATSATLHWQTAPIGKATLVAGYRVAATRLPAKAVFERFLGVRYTVATGPLTAGKFSAYLTPTLQASSPYKANRTITA